MSALPPVDRALPFRPFAHQRRAHALRIKNRFNVLVWPRRHGKTVFSVMELVLGALGCTRENGSYAYLCPFLKQAKQIAWLYLQRFGRAVPGHVVNESELSVTFPNGAKVRLYGADNPDAIRGVYFDGVVLDEVADMKPMLWGEIIRPALTDRQGWALFVGTPKGVNLFSDLYFGATSGKAEWQGWGADLMRASQSDVLPKEEIEDARRQMSPAQFAQEFEVDFQAAVDNVLIRLDDVLEAQRRAYTQHDYHYAPKVLGVDVARYGDDRTVIFRRQGFVAFRPVVLQGASTMDVAGAVAREIDEWQPDATFVDAGGVGAGVIDRLIQLRRPVISVDFGGRPLSPRFENKRAEMWWQMAEWVKSASLPDMVELTKDLTSPTFTYANAKGKLQLESKDDMRARGLPSTDFGDALCTTFSFPVVPKAMVESQGRQSKDQDYDPYNHQEVQ